ncbi:MAG: SHOCT domain-containing protein [Bacilli bacterium]
MAICLFAASFIGALSIFCLFGNFFSNVSQPSPNAFDLIFGTTKYYNINGSYYKATWQRFDILTTLFVFECLIVIFGLVGLFISYQLANHYADEKKTNIFFIIFALLSFLVAILAICGFENVRNKLGGYLADIGAFYLIFILCKFAIVCLCIVYFVIYLLSKLGYGFIKKQKRSYITASYNRNKPIDAISNCNKPINKPNDTSIEKNEDEKIEAIKKYKQLLNEGIITEEEFNKKKSELLK